MRRRPILRTAARRATPSLFMLWIFLSGTTAPFGHATGTPADLPAAVGRQPAAPAESDAWVALKPRVQLFWKEAEESLTLAKQTAWPLISALRRFIQEHPNAPETAEAYYIIGEAYSKLSYHPEALAHWRIVAKHYPRSPWAAEALTAIVLHYGRTGEDEKSRHFYRELIRQYPDSTAALAAWINLAIHTLEAKNLETVELEVTRIEEAKPDIHITVPRFLDLKARIHALRGRETEARELWLHYLNLTRSPAQRADTLFRVAESYRRSDNPIKARKYFNLLKRDFSIQPEGLFAQFRLAQLEARERHRLAAYVALPVDTGLSPAEEHTFSEIIKKYHAHPLTQEVQAELMGLRLNEGRYLEVLRLAHRFLPDMHRADLREKALALTAQAETALEQGKQNIETLREAVVFGRSLLEGTRDTTALPGMSRTTKTLWLKLMKQLLANGEHTAVMDEAWSFLDCYPAPEDGEEARSVALTALQARDRIAIEGGRPLDLVNSHFAQMERIAGLASHRHLFNLGQAWSELQCPKAAMRAFFDAWRAGPPAGDVPDILLAWLRAALDAGDIVSAKAVAELLEQYPEGKDSARGSTLLARLAFAEQDWLRAKTLARKGLDADPTGKTRGELLPLAFKACVKLGHWMDAQSHWATLEPELSPEKQVLLLRFWGDEALRLGWPEYALDAYGRLTRLAPQAPQFAWRVALAQHRSGATGAALEGWKALTQAPDKIWADAAKAMVLNEEFWTGPAGEFRRVPQQRPFPFGSAEVSDE